MGVKEEHVVVYDIIDRMAKIMQDLNKISNYVEDGWRLPNSLQSVLGKIYRYEGRTVSEISRIYDIDLKNTTKYVGELEKRQLIYKQKQGKQKILKLTDEGRRLHNVLSSEKGILLDAIIGEVGMDQVEVTAKVMKRIAQQTHKFYCDLKENA